MEYYLYGREIINSKTGVSVGVEEFKVILEAARSKDEFVSLNQSLQRLIGFDYDFNLLERYYESLEEGRTHAN